jgi:hypothetical protein
VGEFHRRHAIPSKETGSKGKLLAFALVAQWIEQEPSNLLVAGSIPAEGAPPDSQASCTRLAKLTALSRCSGSISAEGAAILRTSAYLEFWRRRLPAAPDVERDFEPGVVGC